MVTFIFYFFPPLVPSQSHFFFLLSPPVVFARVLNVLVQTAFPPAVGDASYAAVVMETGTPPRISPPPPSPKVFFPSCFRKVVAPSPHDADWPTEVIAAALRNVVRRHPLSSVCS